MAALPVLQSSSLTDQAFVALRGAIVVGDLAPGTHLGETRLSADLGISRGTLRDALRRLQQEGLAEVDDRGRHHVRVLSAQTVRDTYTVRASLEGLAAMLVWELDEDARAVAFEQLEARLAAMKAAEHGPILDWIDADINLHKTLCTVSGNRTLLDSWLRLEGVLRMSIMLAGAERARSNMSVARHRELVDAVVAGGPDAEAKVRAHVISAVDGMLSGDTRL